MTKMVRVQISNAHKKSFVEVCKWSCKLEDIVENLDDTLYDNQHITDYKKCITDATKEGSDNSFKDILPFMMMNQQPGQQIDPLISYLLITNL